MGHPGHYGSAFKISTKAPSARDNGRTGTARQTFTRTQYAGEETYDPVSGGLAVGTSTLMPGRISRLGAGIIYGAAPKKLATVEVEGYGERLAADEARREQVLENQRQQREEREQQEREQQELEREREEERERQRQATAPFPETETKEGEVRQFDTSGSWTDVYSSFGIEGPNPYATEKMRPDFDPTFMLPQNMNEVWEVEKWMKNKDEKQRGGGEFIKIVEMPPTIIGGSPTFMVATDDAKYAATGYRPATADDETKAQHYANLQAAMGNIRTEVANWDENATAYKRDMIKTGLQADLEARQNQLIQSLRNEHNTRVDALRERVRGLETELQGATFDHQKAMLDSELEAEEDRLATEMDAAFARVEEQGEQQRKTDEKMNTWKKEQIIEQGNIDKEINTAKIASEDARSAMTLALGLGELEEAQRQAMHSEAMKEEAAGLEQRKFQFAMFDRVANSPEILYFLSTQPGGLADFTDMLGPAVSAAVEDVLADLRERPTPNIQEFAKMPGNEQMLSELALGATEGIFDHVEFLRGSAMYTRGQDIGQAIGVGGRSRGRTATAATGSSVAGSSPSEVAGSVATNRLRNEAISASNLSDAHMTTLYQNWLRARGNFNPSNADKSAFYQQIIDESGVA